MLPLKYPIRIFFLVIVFTGLILLWRNKDQHPAIGGFIKHVDQKFFHPNPVQVSTPIIRANATYVVLVRNSELDAIIHSISDLERHFNHKAQYPYVFLNDEPFTDEFKQKTSDLVSSKAYYGTIDEAQWNQPSWIDEERATAGRDYLSSLNIPYSDSVSYRNMCRFNSGFFYRHPLVQQFRYYWRIEPGVKFYCDVHEDPFVFMQTNNKTYGFTIALHEFEATIATLWPQTKEFMRLHPEFVAKDNAMRFLSDDGGETYNMCHFWSNFEIADMELWRGPAYTAYFDYLESFGGFYYERWGDAPVHTLGAALFTSKDQTHFFSNIGYRHDPFQHCPQGLEFVRGNCECDINDNFDDVGYACTHNWKDLYIH